MTDNIPTRHLLRLLRYLPKKGRIAVIISVVVALLVIYFLPKSFSSVIDDATIVTFSISASEFTTDKDGNLQLDTYTLREQAVDEDMLKEIDEILHSTKYVAHPISLFTWLRFVEDPEFRDPTMIVRLNLKLQSGDYLRVVCQSNADNVRTDFDLNQGSRITRPMDKEVTEALLTYVRTHGSSG